MAQMMVEACHPQSHSQRFVVHGHKKIYITHSSKHRSLFTKGLAHGSYVYMHLNNVSRHLTRYATGSQIPKCVLFCYHKLWVSFTKTFTISHSLSHIHSGVSKCQPLVAHGAVLFSTVAQFYDICCYKHEMQAPL